MTSLKGQALAAELDVLREGQRAAQAELDGTRAQRKSSEWVLT
jgi:hypothetical protein